MGQSEKCVVAINPSFVVFYCLKTKTSNNKWWVNMTNVLGPSNPPSVVFSLFTKPSSIWKPLSPESLHPLSIHRNWPLAQVKRIVDRYSNKQDGLRAANAFKELYKNSFGIAIVEKHLPKLPKQITSWLVLPYNLVLVLGGLQKMVSSLRVPGGFCFQKVGLSWSLGGKHLLHLLRSMSK